MAERPTFDESPTRAPTPPPTIYWQIFITAGAGENIGEDFTIEYLVEAGNVGAAIEKAMQATFDADTSIADIQGIAAKRMPAVIR